MAETQDTKAKTAPTKDSVEVIKNKTKNIIHLDGYKDASGKPVIFGTFLDRHIEHAHNYKVRIKRSVLNQMKKDPIIRAMFDDSDNNAQLAIEKVLL